MGHILRVLHDKVLLFLYYLINVDILVIHTIAFLV